MADQIYLSLWLEADWLRLKHFQNVLELFPFSMLRPGISFLRAYAVSFHEPIFVERAFDEPKQPAEVLKVVEELDFTDLCVEIEGYWDLWLYENRWELKPVPVTFLIKGPEFEDDEDDHIRISLGLDTVFLPQEELPDATRKSKSNLTSLMRFVHEVDENLPLADRRLWIDNESGTFQLPDWIAN